MKNTILFSLLLLMTFCCELAFARSDEKVIIKTERVGNDTAEWYYLGSKDQRNVFVSFKNESLKVADLEKNGNKEGFDPDAMDYFLFNTEEGKQSLISIKTRILENLSQKQVAELLKGPTRTLLGFTLDGEGRIIKIWYRLPAKVESLFTSKNLYHIANEIKKKKYFKKPSHYGASSIGYTLSICKDEFERYLKKE